jgi:hypothetical protein
MMICDSCNVNTIKEVILLGSHIPRGVFRLCFAGFFALTLILGLFVMDGGVGRVERPLETFAVVLLASIVVSLVVSGTVYWTLKGFVKSDDPPKDSSREQDDESNPPHPRNQ